MNVWKRAGIYLTKNKGRCILLFFILTLISGVIMLSLCLRKGSQESVQKLRKTYGSNFFIKADKEGKLPEYNEKTVEKIIEKTRETGGIRDTCFETTGVSLYFGDLEFLPGLHTTALLEIDEEPEEFEYDDYYTKVMMPYGYNKSELSYYFQTNTMELTEGRHVCETDRNVVIISDEIAEKNQLSIGDHITGELSERIANGGDRDCVFCEVDLEIIGIFHANVTQVTNEYTVEWEIIQNNMFVDYGTELKLEELCHEINNQTDYPLSTVIYFYVENPDELEKMMERVREIEDIDWEGLKLEVNDTTYQSALTPLQRINGLSLFMLIFILIVCVILLSLILRMWIKTRKREMGILLSVGIGQKEIVGQFVLEGVILLFAAVVLSAGITAAVSGGIGNQMLSGLNGAEKSRQERQEEIKERIEKGEVASEEEYMSLVDQLTVVTEVETPNEITCNLTVQIVIITAFLLIAVLVVITVLSSREVLKMRPKDILTSAW